MKKVIHITLLCMLCLPGALDAQKSIGIIKVPGIPLSGIPPKTADSIFRSAEKTFFAFQAACSLKDQKTGVISPVSIERYLNLFEFNANVTEDFLFVETPPDIKSPDYATFAYQHLPQGLNVRFVSAEFTNINYDSLGFYRVFARMVKVLKNGVSRDFVPVVKTDSCVVTQYFTFYVEKAEQDKARIFRIQAAGKMTCINDDLSRSIALYGGIDLGAGFTQTRMGNNWPSDGATDVRPNSKPIKVSGLGVGMIFPLKNLPVSLHVGLQYDRFATEVGLDTFIYKLYEVPDPLDHPTQTKFVRGISVSNLVESGQIEVIQAKLGITYWMMEKERLRLGFDILCMPGKILRYKHRLSSDMRYYSTYTYPNQNTGANFQVVIADNLPNQEYLTGHYNFDSDMLSYQTGFLFSMQMAPVLEWSFTGHLALRLSAYCQAPLTHWFKQSAQAATAPFGTGPDDMKYTLLSDYIENYKIIHFGLQAGVQYRF